ncbi:PREDICTED: kinesin-like protein KIF3A [Nicrophorus vespilloides]|uniref:Kinesin-like protein n=1 Tax=Nicrophorus vespilloides TaxID=110193 RepID=A0ABM1M3A1_NICVS|nr:PREDICTED: kinesin-like protein KIF3A [Nicrophorus vespilloides]
MANKKSVLGEVENVRVVIRIRPLNKKEVADGNQNIVTLDQEENVLTLFKVGNEKTKSFKFDHVFGPVCTQMDLYRHIAYPIVEKSFQGYNGTIFAYGQTGTGKTFTMAGNNKVPELKGIIPNAFAHIFTHIARASEEKSFAVTVTYLEIYNEEVRDLLSTTPNNKLEVRERKDVGVYVKDLMGFTVDSIESITELMNRGNNNRITRSTLMNDVSSRSHAIFTITLESKHRADNKTTIGKLNLVDLAGSERLSRTQATGDRLKEASNINQSLSVLGNVISALVDGKSTHIPYRNSKLTRLLQDSLGGNSKTAMIAMVSPSEMDYEESICTLRYASRVKFIKNTARINVETKKGLIECFELEIEKLQQRIHLISLHEEREMAKQESKKKKDITLEEESRKQHEEIEKTEREKTELLSKISLIQKKILVGGENLFEKAKQQEFLLELSRGELQTMEEYSKQLQEEIQKKGQERINVEEQYSTLQEEKIGITKNLKKVQQLLNEVKEEHADKEHEYQREMEALLDNYRLLVRELQLANVMIDNYIPKEYLKTIEGKMLWNTDTTEFQVKGVAYTGNNMRKHMSANVDKSTPAFRGMKNVYHSYNAGKKVERRVRTSSVPRPSHSKRTSQIRSAI